MTLNRLYLAALNSKITILQRTALRAMADCRACGWFMKRQVWPISPRSARACARARARARCSSRNFIKNACSATGRSRYLNTFPQRKFMLHTRQGSLAAFAEGQKVPLLVEEYQKVRIVAWPWTDSTVAGSLACTLGVYFEML